MQQQDFLTNLSSPRFETYKSALPKSSMQPLDDASVYWLTRLRCMTNIAPITHSHTETDRWRIK